MGMTGIIKTAQNLSNNDENIKNIKALNMRGDCKK